MFVHVLQKEKKLNIAIVALLQHCCFEVFNMICIEIYNILNFQLINVQTKIMLIVKNSLNYVRSSVSGIVIPYRIFRFGKQYPSGMS